MKIIILAHGPSLKIFEEAIHKAKFFGLRQKMFASLNHIDVVRKILSNMKADLDFAYFSDCSFIDQYAKESANYLYSNNEVNKTIITSPIFLEQVILKGIQQDFYPYNGNHICSTYGNGIGTDKHCYNSVTALLLTLISIGHRDFSLIGVDGGGPLDKLYYDQEGGYRQGVPIQQINNQLIKDTEMINNYFWKEAKKITSEYIRIINHSPYDYIKCFNKRPLSDLFDYLSDEA